MGSERRFISFIRFSKPHSIKGRSFSCEICSVVVAIEALQFLCCALLKIILD